MQNSTGSDHLKRKLTTLVAALLVVASTSQTLAAEEAGVVLDGAPLDGFNFASLQRGAKTYVNNCIGCHSLQYIRYARLEEDLGIPADVLQSNIAFGQELFAPMNSAMRSEDAKEWFDQAVPPDLSLIARNRSPDWLYTYLKSFYRDPSRPSGWNNILFTNVAMPHVLQSQQGTMLLDEHGKLIVHEDGSLSLSEYDTLVADLINFLVYVGDPTRQTRYRIGYGVMIFLSFMLVLTYMMYREYWRDIK